MPSPPPDHRTQRELQRGLIFRRDVLQRRLWPVEQTQLQPPNRAGWSKRTEERISMLETRNQEIDELMTHEDVYSNSVKCQELAEEKADNDTRLEELYELWAGLEE